MERILVVGATGLLGSRIVRILVAQRRPVRAFVRDVERARELEALGAELVTGDLREPASVRAACAGVTHVITTANAFMEKAGNTPQTVDVAGTRVLVAAARAANVQRFVYVSAVVARPDSLSDYYRCKYEAQEVVRASGVRYTIVRPAAFMDVWGEIVLGKARSGGAAVIFGDGKRPINFVAVDDVARSVVSILNDDNAENQVIDVLGPQELTLLQVVEAFERQVGHPVARKHVPVTAMRVMRRVVRPFNPVLSRMISGSLELATQTPAVGARRQPDHQMTTFAQWLTAEA